MAVKEIISAFFEKLPFRKLAEDKISAEAKAKFPLLDKAIPFANQIVCGFVVLVVVIIAGSSGGYDGSPDSLSNGGSGAQAVNTVRTASDSGNLADLSTQAVNTVRTALGGGTTSGSSSSTMSKAPGRANPDSDFEYRLTSEGDAVIIHKYTGRSSTVVIPETIEGFPVYALSAVQPDTSAGGTALMLARAITGNTDGIFKNAVSVYIPDGIVVFNSVFKNCKRLKEVRLPDDLENISQSCF